jgi:Fic family protein
VSNLPTVSFEELEWEPKYGYSSYDMNGRQFPRGKYKAAVLSPISDINLQIESDIAELYADTLAGITRFDDDLSEKSIVMPSILLRSESASSSQIEKLTTSTKNIALAQLGDISKQNATIVAGNIYAMQKALENTDKISVDSILQVHKSLMENTGVDFAGQIRKEPVWIGGGNSPHTAKFVPPKFSRVNEYLEDLVKFSNRYDVSPLLQAAVAHCQFETIHPFADGNGRTGRALIQIILHNARVIRKSALPISAGLLGNLNEYFIALEKYREGDYSSMLKLFCYSAQDAIFASRVTADAIEELRDVWLQKITARKDSVIWELLDLILTQPVINVNYVSEELGVSAPAARAAIDQLLEADILSKTSTKLRNVTYQAKEVTEIMDNFSKSIQKRGGK